MADDTRETTTLPPEEDSPEVQVRRPRKPKPKHEFPKTQAGKLWDAFGNPDEPVNTMPGGMVNSAGGRPPEVTWRNAFRFSEDDAKRWYRTSCAKDSLMVGIATGGAIGGSKFILSGFKGLASGANYAAGAFIFTAVGMYTWCEQRRRKEAQGIAMAVAGMKILTEKKARERAAEEAADAAAAAQAVKAAEEERQRNKRWFW